MAVHRGQVEEAQLRLPPQPLDDLQRVLQPLQRRREPRQDTVGVGVQKDSTGFLTGNGLGLGPLSGRCPSAGGGGGGVGLAGREGGGLTEVTEHPLLLSELCREIRKRGGGGALQGLNAATLLMFR